MRQHLEVTLKLGRYRPTWGEVGGEEGEAEGHRHGQGPKGAIVNIEAIAEIRSLFHGDYDVLLRDGTALPVGRTYRDRLLGRMGDSRS